MRLGRAQQDAWIAFFVGHGQLTRKIERDLAQAGQPGLEVYDVLLALELAPERRLKMSELADRLVYSRSGLTRMVDRLERAGWVQRASCPADRRAIHAVLTDAGLAVREAAWPAYRDAIQEHFGALLSEDEARHLALLLGRFAECSGLGEG